MVRILLVDDHRILRQALARMLDTVEDFEVVGEAADGEEAIALARTRRPDVILMDVSMPRLNGIDATKRIHEETPGVRIIGLSMHDDANVKASMRQAGAFCHIGKGGPLDVLFAAIRGEPVEGGRAGE